MRLWDKGGELDDRVLRFTVGRDHELDRRLVPYDVRASRAHAEMLAACGHLTTEESRTIVAGLDDCLAAFGRGEWTIQLEDEDVHTALENQLISRIGEAGEKVHLGRSRNDQVLAALRLYYLDAIQVIRDRADQVVERLHEIAERSGSLAMPGYTHMQPAMPSSVGEWAGGYAAEVGHSASSLAAAETLASLNPLGSAAGYGTPGLPLDRSRTSQSLGFQKTHEPATAVQLSRGKAEAALAFGIALLLGDLGRLASDLCLFSTREFGFVRLPEAFTTGSSIMPQKRNPDVFELVRARAAMAPSDLQAIFSLTARLGSGYHRDMQLLKEPLFRMIDHGIDALEIMAAALPGIVFEEDRIAAAMTPELHAAQRAFEIVKGEGISFRAAYRKVASELGEG